MRIAVIDDYNGVAAELECWRGLPQGCEVTFFADHLDAPQDLVERLSGFEAVVCMRERTAFGEAVLGALPGLRLLVTTGLKNAAIDLPAAARLGITVCGTRMPSFPAAEMAWALILELARRAGAQDSALRAGVWQDGVGTGLDGLTLGVVGLGRLGRRVARIGTAFGMDVQAWSPNLTQERATAAGDGIRAVGKQELFETSDVVSVHMKLAASTTAMIGAEQLRAMRPTAYLVNTSRGPLVEQDALVTALREGWIAGAGLDVFDTEPLPADHVLRQTRNTVLTPHIGYVTGDTFTLAYGDAVDAVTAYLAGAPVRVLGTD
ncbi:D-2-hydroxyacid dehydrogenase family protein [Streptantibioticus silvisoli]|uniref:D-2-hydroxyacid dehydrogenase family protein n=1 Tax=Streptantibioticus silvisoli TaxID=2705255 RepID=A0ABT6VU44_9ACTN|nr:D-2-hydroxyacid dehydrogenase family protein [Streptantibioticus silvisoli]MDI5961987.1 D-2-hydroxyacid dehydrogenase family protein [Streptantibioticus silvisoli]